MRKIIAGTLFLGLTSGALANNNFSGEFLIGQADQQGSTRLGKKEGSDTSLGFRGAYAFNKNIALELAYQDYGDASDKYVDDFGDNINDTMNTTAINLGVKGTLPFDNGFSLQGRAGLSMWDYELTETDSFLPGTTYRGGDSGTDLYFGLGAQYNITQRIFIGAEYTMLEFDTKLNKDFKGAKVKTEVDNLSLSIGIHF